MDKDNRNIQQNDYEEFLSLLRSNEKKIFGHILLFVPNRALAEEIMHETLLVMWRKYPEYKQGSNFSAWGVTIGRFLVMEYYRRESRSIVHFSTDALENISEVSESSNVFDAFDDRLEALKECLKKLPEELRQILRLRYEQKTSIKEIAEKLERPTSSLYKRISRVHVQLQQCINSMLSGWKGAL